MHELSLALSLVEETTQIVKDNNAVSVNSLSIQVGKLSGVDPHALEFCFLEAAKNSPLENAQLEIIEVKVEIFCPECQKHNSLDDFLIFCPHCYNKDVKVLAGKEFKITKMEVI